MRKLRGIPFWPLMVALLLLALSVPAAMLLFGPGAPRFAVGDSLEWADSGVVHWQVEAVEMGWGWPRFRWVYHVCSPTNPKITAKLTDCPGLAGYKPSSPR